MKKATAKSHRAEGRSRPRKLGVGARLLIDGHQYRLEQPTDDGYYQVCCYYCSVLLDDAGGTVGLVCARCDTPFLLEQAHRCPDCGDLHCPNCGTTIKRG